MNRTQGKLSDSWPRRPPASASTYTWLGEQMLLSAHSAWGLWRKVWLHEDVPRLHRHVQQLQSCHHWQTARQYLRLPPPQASRLPGPVLRQDQEDQGGRLQHLQLLPGQTEAQIRPSRELRGGRGQGSDHDPWRAVRFEMSECIFILHCEHINIISCLQLATWS